MLTTFNTGNKDFIFNDRFVDSEDPYKHSKWLSFMEKRLRLSRSLLKNSGIIFISINDHDQSQSKLLCDEIFTSENFVANLVWENREGGESLSHRKISPKWQGHFRLIVIYLNNLLNNFVFSFCIILL